jgi:phosphoglucomutase
MTGNMSGCLLADYEISQKMEANGGKVPEDGKLIKTIVTSNMTDVIAEYYNVEMIEVLTGFKYIGQQILQFEQRGKGEYLFGFEESYGCLIGTHARDKDAIVATMALCEAAAYYKSKNMTLWDALVSLYDRYGYFKDDIKSITLSGIEGLAKIDTIMNTLRENPPKKLGKYDVVAIRDYKLDTIKHVATGEVTTTGLPTSNVLYYDLTDHAWMCVRPSGTEPKIKIYFGVVGTSIEDAENESKKFVEDVMEIINPML